MQCSKSEKFDGPKAWRESGVSPFLFPFGDRIQLSILPVPVDAIQDCLDLLQRGCSFHLHSDNLFLSDSPYTSDIVRFYYRADLPRSPTLIGPLASWRGDFPQTRRLSAALLHPPFCRGGRTHFHPLGIKCNRFHRIRYRNPSFLRLLHSPVNRAT